MTNVTFLYASTMCLSGALLFLIQPMFAKMVLPLFGGAPAVWNTAMLFYQVTLLAGYLYAHGLRRWLPVRWQVIVHLGVVLLPAAVLPMHVAGGLAPVGGEDPVPALLLLFGVGVGLPFFVVSTTSPLLQSWFGDATLAEARDPYALYAASNAGSMLALLAYPFVIEPSMRFDAQSLWWSVAYAAFGLLVASCALHYARRADTRHAQAPASVVDAAPRIGLSWLRRARWVLLAFVPSSLMLSVTTYMSTNIAPVPLLWILPLALYLLTFIVAFGSRRFLSTEWLRRAFPLVLLPLLALTLSEASSPIRLMIGIHLVAFTLLALTCHAELAVDSPPGPSITEFYLWVSVGGALGGIFNALIAPRLFDSVLEYPVALVIAALVMRPPLRGGTGSVRESGGLRALDLALPILVSASVLLTHSAIRMLPGTSAALAQSAALGVALLLCFPLATRPLRFGLGVAAIVVANGLLGTDRRLLLSERSFFGISRVVSAFGFHELAHGNISHGSQDMRSAVSRREPRTYYTRSSPVGQLIRARQAAGGAGRVAVVGLGAGSLACYARAGDLWTFYEIDPVVVRIARDPKWFTYLQDCAPTARILLGDARLSLQAAPDAAYDLLLLDAYSADAIPLHLITREALALYRRKVAADGVIAFHISNRYFDLEPVVSALAGDAGLRVLLMRDLEVSLSELLQGKTQSIWMVIAQPSAALEPLLRDPAWRQVRAPAGYRPWTDDFSSTISALR